MKELELPKDLYIEDKCLIDDDFRIGHLDNGLTYYIRHNEEPKDQCNFEIVHKVGSMQEEEHQRGLAHFLEHMAFNGTEHFPGYNSIRDHLDKYGISSSCINASTTHYYTHYYLRNIPCRKSPQLIDDCLRIVADWSGSLLLDGECIERERGVVKTELLRCNSNINRRLWSKVYNSVTSSNRYAQRLPIGELSVIENFPYSAIKEFCSTWYAPKNQAVIVVGDIDADVMEQKVRDIFSGCKSDPCAQSPSECPMVMNPGPIFAFASDKELGNTCFHFFCKYPNPYLSNMGVASQIYIDIIFDLLESMIRARLSDMMKSKDSPFFSMGGYVSSFFGSSDINALRLICSSRVGLEEQAYRALLSGLMEMRNAGFSEEELDLARKAYIRSEEDCYAERNHIHNSEFSAMCFDNFIDGNPILSEEKSSSYTIKLAKAVTLEQINQTIRSIVSGDGSNSVSLVFATQNADGSPTFTCDQLRRITGEVYSSCLMSSPRPVWKSRLLMQDPPKGRIVSEDYDPLIDAHILHLHNGAKVYYKVTDFKDDEIRFRFSAVGGTSQFNDDDFPNFRILDDAITYVGLSEMSGSDLTKFLCDKSLSYDVYASEFSQTIKGWTSIRDLKTLMEVIYCLFTNPGHSSNDFKNYINRKIDNILSRRRNPVSVIVKRVESLRLVDNSRDHYLTIDEAERADLNRILQMHRLLFSDASSFNFYFAGSISEEEFRKIVPDYIGALPCVDMGSKPRPDAVKNDIRPLFHFSDLEMEEPLSVLSINYTNFAVPYTLRNRILGWAMEKYIDSKVVKEMRVKASISYSCGASLDISRNMKNPSFALFSLAIVAEVQPEHGLHCKRLFDSLEASILRKGISAAELSGIKAEIRNAHDVDLKSNNSWLFYMENWIRFGLDLFSDYDSVLESITPESFNQFVRDILQGSTKQTYVFVPKGVKQV